MILTRKTVADLRLHCRWAIDKELEASLLRQFGVEPYPHEYSEQDLYEQVRKAVNKQNSLLGNSSPSINFPRAAVEPGRG
jgi:hypothetical protein